MYYNANFVLANMLITTIGTGRNTVPRCKAEQLSKLELQYCHLSIIIIINIININKPELNWIELLLLTTDSDWHTKEYV
jgi:hypothetical protein